MFVNAAYTCDCVTDGSACAQCRMSSKDKKMEETSASGEPHQHVALGGAGGEQGRHWGWMLSGIVCVNIIILGCTFVTATAHNSMNISASDLQAFLIFLILITSSWILYYTIYTARTKDAVVYKDGHAGPIWLRGGLVLFGLLSIIMDIFKIVSYAGYLECESAVKVAFPVVQLLFVFVQTYYLWFHAKDCVQLQKNFTRCGLMLTLSTNLVLWMSVVTEESIHQTTLPEYSNQTSKLSGRSLYMYKASHAHECKCSHTSCSLFQEAYYYLYPFNIEYCLFASAMTYVMWKNVGRVADEHTHHKLNFRIKDVFLGPVLGILLVVAGLATFVVYETEILKSGEDKVRKDKAVMIHYVMNIVIVTLMSVCTVIGLVIFKMDQREHVSEKNPTRSLDVALLLGASLGQFVLSYFTTLATVATGVLGYLNGLNLSWAILLVVQLGLQNVFIIEGLHREPFHDLHPGTVIVNPYSHASKGVDGLELGMGMKPSQGLEGHGHAADNGPRLWRRWILKEVCMFLLLGNVMLWIMPAFGARPQFDLSTEMNFYGFSLWASVVNVGLPFGIFYRMHSVAGLFEVFLTS
ncbi:proton channel OTOP2 [Betta splendens]|uniref:Proton channel OTOP2 n=1 Tax=Betta splendens TaxID=158456 RepID=A0A6P7NCU0_BETSP|nr:proton channel OTOP2 [Betta splendens]